eukprot:SAG22_NODE_3439_length_1711_cov_1.852357_2_plen_283_part_00
MDGCCLPQAAGAGAAGRAWLVGERVCLADGRLGQTAKHDPLSGRVKVWVDAAGGCTGGVGSGGTEGGGGTGGGGGGGGGGEWVWRDQTALSRLGTAAEVQTARAAGQMRALVACWAGRYWETMPPPALALWQAEHGISAAEYARALKHFLRYADIELGRYQQYSRDRAGCSGGGGGGELPSAHQQAANLRRSPPRQRRRKWGATKELYGRGANGRALPSPPPSPTRLSRHGLAASPGSGSRAADNAVERTEQLLRASKAGNLQFMAGLSRAEYTRALHVAGS